ncbi:hypothetical protein Cpap_2611 [Ruminiclostridium papyrosolvens DSM 2782]|uniref:Uncharacterized protein n=1 Tax=Ruminiclostridium papyrosolvens DSM 2782 TaxID=588581 RepID=F1TC11_9FIRM|nr:hypothetical protein [Ruminiclostridium papyrosolvens]EGD47926.1 hypothetical protein Cpap_2611 [Ruminiclostridium papyrosolvens DSM 2782]WES36577.1 hypothetical protein P0092_04150 [Ruminiclostridium papyrosolvens DSM 2782]
MILKIPPNANMEEGSIIALTKNDIFIGYAEVIMSTNEALMLSVDNKAIKTFNELFGEQIPFTIDLF